MKPVGHSTPRVPAKKSLGQHFLHDQGVLQRISHLAVPEPGSGLIEIGPGTGNLTAALLAAWGAVDPDHGCLLTIEPDRCMHAVLADRFADAVAVLEADAARVDWSDLLRQETRGSRPVVVGNLPYYASLPILFSLLEGSLRPARIVAMVQREVADRLVASAGAPARGQVSVKVQMLADVRLALKVGRGAFSPPPKVESAVLVFQPLPRPRMEIPDYNRFSRLVSAGFHVRRKTLANSLLTALCVPPDVTRAALADLGLNLLVRAEVLDLGDWAGLALRLDPELRNARSAPDARQHEDSRRNQ